MGLWLLTTELWYTILEIAVDVFKLTLSSSMSLMIKKKLCFIHLKFQAMANLIVLQLDNSKQVRTILDYIKPNWIILDNIRPFETLETISNRFGQYWTSLDSYGPF